MRLRDLPRSMLGQITLLSIVFVGIGVYYLAVLPITQMRDAPVDPRQMTQNAIVSAMNDLGDAIVAGEAPEAARARLENTYQRIKAANPDFSYFLLIDGRIFSAGGAPRHYDDLRAGTLIQLKRNYPYPGLCINIDRAFGSRGAAALGACDHIRYSEYDGLVRPVIANSDLAVPYYEKFALPFSRTFLIFMAAIFLSFAAILMLNMVLLKRVARLAASLDPETLDTKLPERGLPIEVISLVRAVNFMIAKVEEAQRRRRFFLSAAAHEMRTPLTVLRTRLEMLDDSQIKTKLIADVRRMSGLVNQLLTLMSLSPRRLDTTADLVTCCRKVIDEREPLMLRRAIAVHFDAAAPRAEVVGDARLIRVAIANLLDNALTFSDDGARIDLTLDADGRIVVRDHGPGIDEDRAHTLFDAFVRLAPGNTGHGLGLAIVRAIVDLHGGDVDVANAPGGGARFTASFGALIDEEEEEEEDTARPPQ